jgi:hypothetical protein
VVFEIVFFSPVLKSPTHIGFIGVKKMGQKSHTWAPLKQDKLLFMHSIEYDYAPISFQGSGLKTLLTRARDLYVMMTTTPYLTLELNFLKNRLCTLFPLSGTISTIIDIFVIVQLLKQL